MFGFLIKKSFFDLWDNFLPAILVNLGFIVVIAIPLLLPSAAATGGPLLAIAALILGVIVTFVFLGGVYTVAGGIADYTAPHWRDVLDGIKSHLPTTIFLSLALVVHAALIAIAIPVYTALGNLFGLFALALLFWMSVIWLLSVQYILPIRGRLDSSLPKILRKSFLLTFDNVFFTLGIAIGGAVIIVVSFLTAFLFPGIMGLAIWYHSALKLRLYKYDYREEHPEGNRNEIPWDALLYDDRERVGKRSIRGMIFPWKE